MGTTANVYIKSDNKTEKFSIFMDGQYANLGVYILEQLSYSPSDLLNNFRNDHSFESDIEDKQQEYIYRVDLQTKKMDVYHPYKTKINKEVKDYLKNNRKDLLSFIEIENSLKKLPIGISTLEKIINGNFAYVDKTHIALDLIENGAGYYFLSRPRRFGKSLFLDTLKSIFKGKKELFKGLAIYDHYDFKPHPIIKISFGGGGYRGVKALHQSIYEILRYNQKELGVTCESGLSSAGCLRELIYETHNKYQSTVVILIDEYDKPILDNIENPKIAKAVREELKDFYSVIKDNDEYIRFVFITGVSKFSKVSLFSGLNNLNDITLNPNYSTICGYTQADVETIFASHLEGQDFAKIKKWYNGYQWMGESVYNPFDILLFISNNYEYRNYWFSTATPTFLLKLIEKCNYFLPKLESIKQDERMLNSFDVDFIDLEVLMWQTGYLTIEKTRQIGDDILYYLTIPNHEVRTSLMIHIADYMSKISNSISIKSSILEALYDKDISALEKHMKALFAAIAYNNFTGEKLYKYEGYYVSVFYAYLKSFGIELIAEDVTNKGRIDLTIKLPNIAVYIIEFKVDGSDALKQIRNQGYHEKYLSEGLPIYLIGIEFDTIDRNIDTVKFEMIAT